MLGALLAAILILAVATSLRVYGQLDRAERIQHSLIVAQRDLDAVLRVQLEESGALRGYLDSGKAIFLDPYLQGTGRFEAAVDAVRATTRDAEIEGIDGSARDLLALHANWLHDVANPLIARPLAPGATELQTIGKVLVDRETDTIAMMRGTIDQRLAVAQRDLKSQIDEGLFSGLGSAVVFGFVSIAFVLSSRQMLAVIDREREIVETLQGAFRTDLDPLPGARLGTAYLSADQDAAVGGDLYDVRALDATRGLVVVADVSGKGIKAAVNTAFVKYSIRTLALTYSDPGDLLARFNAVFAQTISDPNLFVVAFVGVFDANGRTLKYASAGHSGAYLRRGHSVAQLEVTGPIVGLGAAFAFETREIALAAGDVLLLATDGLTEARDATGSLLQDGGAMAWLEEASIEPQRCADELANAVRDRNGGVVRDDLALLVIAID